VPADRETAFWFSGLVFTGEHPPVVNDLCDSLKALGVEARPFWKPVHFQKPYKDAPREALPVTEDLWSRIITLPCSTSLTPDMQAIVIDAVKKVLSS
jgi:dTDP-4-amino-4,6-dideoxygalactose transaminase